MPLLYPTSRISVKSVGRAYLCERKPWTATVRAFLKLIAYGLRVLLSLLPPPPGYKAIY